MRLLLLCLGEEDFRARVLRHHDLRFVPPMLHTSICTYIPGRSRGDIHWGQCMHVARARRNMRTALTASARAAAAGCRLERWNGNVRCCGGRRCCRRYCCCCCGCCLAAAAVPRFRYWTTVKPLSDPPPGLGRRASSTMSCGGGGVVGRSYSDGCPWLAGAAGSSRHVECCDLEDSTNGRGVVGSVGTALQL